MLLVSSNTWNAMTENYVVNLILISCWLLINKLFFSLINIYVVNACFCYILRTSLWFSLFCLNCLFRTRQDPGRTPLHVVVSLAENGNTGRNYIIIHGHLWRTFFTLSHSLKKFLMREWTSTVVMERDILPSVCFWNMEVYWAYYWRWSNLNIFFSCILKTMPDYYKVILYSNSYMLLMVAAIVDYIIMRMMMRWMLIKKGGLVVIGSSDWVVIKVKKIKWGYMHDNNTKNSVVHVLMANVNFPRLILTFIPGHRGGLVSYQTTPVIFLTISYKGRT